MSEPAPRAIRMGALAILALIALAIGSAIATLAWHATRPAASSETLSARGGPDVVTAVRDLSRLESAEYHMERVIELTSTQFNVLEVLMRNAGRVVSKKELSEQALGRPLARFDRSLDVHLSSIRQKLGAAADLIRTVRGTGYHLVKD